MSEYQYYEFLALRRSSVGDEPVGERSAEREGQLLSAVESVVYRR